MRKYSDIKGNKYGRLTTLERLPTDKKNSSILWLCKCDCGNETYVRATMLRSGHTKSCGCLAKERVIESVKTHGMTGTRIYNIWCQMRYRCSVKARPDYKYYGGRGITVCQEWLEFETFYKWAIENGYSDELSIDRIDNYKGYFPGNCRWATVVEQRNNMRSNRRFLVFGEILSLTEVAEKYLININTIRYRLSKGQHIEKIIREKYRIKQENRDGRESKI